MRGFTLVEIMIIVVVVGILGAIAIPSYQQYLIRGSRTDVKTAMAQIAQKLTAYKLANNDFGASNSTSGYATNPLTNPAIFGYSTPNTSPVYPQTGKAYYNLMITASPTNSWTMTATPISGTRQGNDGLLRLNDQGWTCWNKTNGTSTNLCVNSQPTSTSTWDGN